MSKILIAGFNRTGTTFLVSYYHQLGYVTGFDDEFVNRIQADADCSHGGIELLRDSNYVSADRIRQAEVIKHAVGYAEPLPWDLSVLNDLSFAHRILTRRDPEAMIQSSIRRVRLKELRVNIACNHPERLDYTAQLKFYEDYNEKLIRWMGDCIEVEFPRSVRDFDYLWGKLEPTFGEWVNRDMAKDVWLDLAKERYVTYG